MGQNDISQTHFMPIHINVDKIGKFEISWTLKNILIKDKINTKIDLFLR
jgi:hypothetical protein